MAVTQAGKSSIDETHPLALGAVGVTGTSAANALAADADLVLAVGTRLQDFTTGSWALFKTGDLKIVALNVTPYDTAKHNALPLVCDAKVGLKQLSEALGGWRAEPGVAERARREKAIWLEAAEPRARAHQRREALGRPGHRRGGARPRRRRTRCVVNASGGLPGELHKLWSPTTPGSYHMEYGFSCMGYEIAGGVGVKMARPDKEVVVMVGDGSYMMMNSEIATSVSLGQKLIVVVLDNHGFGCINRLQMATGGANFNNLWRDCAMAAQPDIDFRKHAESMGAIAVKASSIGDLESRARGGQGERPHHGHRHRDPSADHHRGRRALVGRRRGRGFAARRSGEGPRTIRDRAPPPARVRLSARRARTPAKDADCSHGREEEGKDDVATAGEAEGNPRPRHRGDAGKRRLVARGLRAPPPRPRRKPSPPRRGRARSVSTLISGKAQAGDRRQGFRRDRRAHEPVRRVRPGPPTRRPASRYRGRRDDDARTRACARRRAAPAIRPS